MTSWLRQVNFLSRSYRNAADLPFGPPQNVALRPMRVPGRPLVALRLLGNVRAR